MTQSKQRLAVLGSTGSIGTQTLDIVRRYGDRFEITTLSAHSNWKKLVEQAVEFTPDNVVIADKTHYTAVRDALADHPVKVYAGSDALEQVVCSEQVDTVVMALVGYSGLFPTVSALKHGKKVALANKECLVVAGEIVTRLSAEHRAPIIPVDSEHSAIFQCLTGEHSAVEKVILTASGGPFLHRPAEELERVSVEEALNHPSWCMGAKVTIDSASLMNKALELIEARHLFNVPPERLKVVIHPQSLVHSMVELCDGSFIAQMSKPDMRFAIQYALTWPERAAEGGLPELDFARLVSLDFREPDRSRFPSLDFAYHAMHIGGTMTAAMNAANEVAVDKFRRGEIGFAAIWTIIEKTMSAHHTEPQSDLAAIRDADRRAREFASQLY